MITKSPNDPRRYRYLQLENGLRVLLVQQPESPKAAAALAVRVGHFDDPPKRQGLAHFLEHMLFLGTDRFPEPEAYPQFISQHGGRNNAWTGTEFTNYFFDVDPTHFEPALERFSRFFIAPQLSPKYVDKERHAVNSEYQLKLRDALRRRYQVHKETVNPQHPFSKFSVGSLDTLGDLPDQSLHQDVTEFYRSHYSANIMSLVLLSPEPLEQLSQQANAYFAEIPNLELNKQLPDEPLYLDDQLGILIRLKPLKDTRRLMLTFPFGAQIQNYREKPLSFLAHLLGWEGSGSLLALLKQRGLVNSLSVGGGMGGYNFKDFSLTFGLTRDGVSHYDEIIGHLFEHLALMRQQGYISQLYQDRARLSELGFRYQEKSDAIDWCSHLAVNLHHYPEQDLLSADHVMRGMNESLYEHTLAQLTPERLRAVLISPEQETDRTARWYHTEYAVEALSPELLARWEQARPHPELKLPEANPWLPDDPKVWEIAEPTDKPSQLIERPDLSLWWLADNEFNVPRGYINLALHCSLASQSAQSQVLSRMLVDLLTDQLHQSLYAAEVAGFHYRIQTGLHGLGCQTTGYSEHQVELLGEVLAKLREGSFDAKRFNALSDRQLQAWDNASKERPLTLLFQSMAELLYQNRFNPRRLASELREVTPQQLTDYAASWHQNLHVQGLAVGNWRESDMQQMIQQIDTNLLSSSSAQGLCGRQITALPASGGSFALSSEHGDSALVMFWQAENNSFAQQAAYAMASQVLGPEFFHQLRTEQQLGYQLGVSYYPISGHPGLIAYLQSPVASPQAAYQAFTTFFHEYASTFRQQKSDSWWAQQKQALLTQLEAPDNNLAMRTQRLWIGLQNGDWQFEQRQRLSSAISALSLEQFADSLEQLFLRNTRQPLVLSCLGTSHQQEAEFTPPGEPISDIVGYRQRQPILDLS